MDYKDAHVHAVVVVAVAAEHAEVEVVDVDSSQPAVVEPVSLDGPTSVVAVVTYALVVDASALVVVPDAPVSPSPSALVQR
jgi:hypothetical protein